MYTSESVELAGTEPHKADSQNQTWPFLSFAKFQLRLPSGIHALVNLVSLPDALVNLVSASP